MSIDRVDDYRAGACNIGPAEIARRRMTGHVGAAAAVALFAGLLLIGAPAWWRLWLAVPAGLGAAGYLQAVTRFCAAYGWRGVFNFGSGGFGSVTSVADTAARRADRVKAATIGAGSALAGGLVGLAAFLLG